MSGLGIFELSEQMVAQAAAWQPERMPAAIDELAKMGPAMRNVAQCLHILATRTGQEWPLHPAISGLTGAAVQAQVRVAQAADQVPPAVRQLHADDLARHEAPRQGEHMWDVR